MKVSAFIKEYAKYGAGIFAVSYVGISIYNLALPTKGETITLGILSFNFPFTITLAGYIVGRRIIYPDEKGFTISYKVDNKKD